MGARYQVGMECNRQQAGQLPYTIPRFACQALRKNVVFAKHYLQALRGSGSPMCVKGSWWCSASSSRWNAQGFSPTTHITSSHTSGMPAVPWQQWVFRSLQLQNLSSALFFVHAEGSHCE